MAVISGLATQVNGDLTPIDGCDLIIPGAPRLNGSQPGQIVFTSLPELSDQKSASYNPENVIGRALPIMTFAYGEGRNISVTANFYILKQGDSTTNLKILRAIQSAVYPRQGTGTMPYYPPPVCKIRCGRLLAKDYLCVLMKSYNVKFPTDVPWNINIPAGGGGILGGGGALNDFVPYKMEVSMEFETTYASSQLPNQEQIITDL